MGAHIVNGEFQSDKYPACPPGKVPLSVKDPTAQDLLWEYAQRRRLVDAEFSDDLELVLREKGYQPSAHRTLKELDDMITALTKERDEWKRRAAAHGCDTEKGDVDCG